jgi:hypothetical protein
MRIVMWRQLMARDFLQLSLVVSLQASVPDNFPVGALGKVIVLIHSGRGTLSSYGFEVGDLVDAIGKCIEICFVVGRFLAELERDRVLVPTEAVHAVGDVLIGRGKDCELVVRLRHVYTIIEIAIFETYDVELFIL